MQIPKIVTIGGLKFKVKRVPITELEVAKEGEIHFRTGFTHKQKMRRFGRTDFQGVGKRSGRKLSTCSCTLPKFCSTCIGHAEPQGDATPGRGQGWEERCLAG